MQSNLVGDYISNGWSLVPIPPGGKGPRVAGWNQKGAALTTATQLPEGYGVGLAHAYSGTMALDIDDWELTRQYGIDVDALYRDPHAVIIHSGKQGHGKLLYRMPFGLVLPSKKVQIDKKVAFELRCGTAEGLTVQDVLPPSTHPETKQPYQWAGSGHWSLPPVVPQPVLDLWLGLLKEDTKTVKVDGIDASWDEIREALKFISPDCSREDWINVGMALHWAATKTFNPDEGLAVWNEWSWGSLEGKYPGPEVIAQQWRSFRVDKGSSVTLGTLYHLARQGGWVRPMPDASDLFGKVEAFAPQDIMQSLRPSPPDIDLSLFPAVLKQRATEISDTVGCDPLVPLFAGLAAVCGAVDAQSRLELMPGYQVPPVLWLMTIGDPADKKSPGSAPMLEPLARIEAEDRPRFKKELIDWEAKEAAYSTAKKDFIDFHKSTEAVLGGTVGPELPKAPEQPIPLRILVNDITSQKLVRHAADRPRGLLCSLDEMNSWVHKMSDRTSGEDRSAWVRSYEAKRYEMDRVGAGSFCAENFAVSIYGNIQPRVFRENINALSNDGLLQRFIPAILRHNKTRLGEPMPAFMTTEAKWENTLRLVYALPTQTYKLSADAYLAYREFQRWYEQAKQDERLLNVGDVYMTAFGKLEGLCGRLILLFHIIEQPFNTVVSASLVERVVKLVRGYIIPAYRYLYGEVGGATPFDLWITDYVIQYCDQPTLTLSEVRRSARRQLEHLNTHMANQWVLNAMYNLEQAHWVARTDDGTKEHQGRAEWMVNPALREMFQEHRKKVIQAKQRYAETVMKDRYNPVPPRVYGASQI